jgi:hypothetical protein
MSFSFVGSSSTGGNSTAPFDSHGLSINSGDLVISILHTNDNTTTAPTIDAPSTGASWSATYTYDVPSETCWLALAWKIANGSEDSNYSWTTSASTNWRVINRVYRPTGNTPEVDAAIQWTRNVSKWNPFRHEAQSGETVAANGVSIIFCGKDNRASGGFPTGADDSYTDGDGATNDQALCAYSRIDTGSGFSPISPIEPTSGPSLNDNPFSGHISFVEGSGATGQPAVKRFGGVPYMAINRGVW